MGSTEDIQRFGRRLRRERARLEDSDELADADVDAIKRLLRAKDGDVAISTLEAYSRRLRMSARIADRPLVELDQDSYEALVYEMRHEHDLSDSTVRNRENAMCIFLDEIVGAEWIEEVDRTIVEDTQVDPADMLDPEDIRALVDAARHQRDVALIDILADTGARLSLVASLRVKDVSLDGEQATYRPNSDAIGLKGAEIKPYPIVDSAATLRNYLHDSHPRPEEPEAALIHKMRRFDDDVSVDDGSLAPNHIRQTLTRIADRAGVEKPVNPHNFRHSAITRMYREGYSKGQIQHRVQWTIDTDMWERYVHLEAEELNDDIFAAAGITDPDEDRSDPTRQECGNCRESLAPHHEYCPRCGDAVSPESRDTVDEFVDRGIDHLADGDLTASERRMVTTAIKAIRAENSSVQAAAPPSASSSDSEAESDD